MRRLARLGRLVEQLLHLIDERAAVWRGHRDSECAALIDRAGINRVANSDGLRRRLAGDQALVDG